LALSRNIGRASSNLWLLDLDLSTSRRFTFGSGRDADPVWSPDGSRIVFSSKRDGRYYLCRKPVSGVQDEEVLLKSSDDEWPESWSRDGRFLLYGAENPKTKSDIWVLPMEGDRKPAPFLVTEFEETHARFSPDGRWVAYVSDESGKYEVYVRSFSMNSAGTATGASGKLQISNGFGTDPRWRGDGRELYYRSADGRVMAVEIATHPEFRVGKPQQLGPLTPLGRDVDNVWDSTADGKRFLMAPVTKHGPEQYTVVLNWQAGLRKIAPKATRTD
jgi:Tol biopolymer transport system component